MPKKRKHLQSVAFSIDMDGCLYIPNSKDTAQTINARVKTLVSWLAKYIDDFYPSADTIHLFLGSARQTKLLDTYNNFGSYQGRYNGAIPSCFDVMENLKEQLENALCSTQDSHSVHLETLLLGDIIHKRMPGYFFNEYQRHSFESIEDTNLAEANDEYKLNIIYYQTCHLAKELSESAKINFFLIDDRRDIILKNHNHFNKKPKQLPANVRLDYLQFAEHNKHPHHLMLNDSHFNLPIIQLSVIEGEGYIHDPYDKLTRLCQYYLKQLDIQAEDYMQFVLKNNLNTIENIANHYKNETYQLDGSDKQQFLHYLLYDTTLPGQPSYFTKFFCCYTPHRKDLAGAMESFYKYYIEPKPHLQEDNNYNFSCNS